MTDKIAELEAKIEELKAEKIDMLLHPEKYFSTYRDIKTVYKRAERLEAENAALKADPEKYFSIYRDIKTVFKRLERLEAENAALRAERDRMKAALMDIASAGCNEACEWLENDCDKCMLETAQQALRGEVIL